MSDKSNSLVDTVTVIIYNKEIIKGINLKSL